ncbi:MAG: crossover junction endodeoxyribonuclease RuvC [Porticoccaceae bacterium]|nr:crossover junction endodeoxyribonuclease RuvC [Porticoccaceae bacterium]MDG1474996.1 crossover junction endodeoxyribonuclease RuvC [Porticoccaceae bacterium]
MLRILGIDPGSRRTGYGLIDVTGSKISYVSSGIIRLPEKSLPDRLKIIFDGVSEIVEQYKPHQMAIEEVFFAKDPRAALKLGQARGAAIVAGVNVGLEVGEYSARSVKQAVVGTGGAEKGQVQMMITQILKLPASPSEDAADALAVAICHAHSLHSKAALGNLSKGYARGRHK